MQLLVLGASGATGRLLVDAALRRDHDVTALVRNPAGIDVRPGLTVLPGDARSAADLEGAMAGADAVVSTLGAGRGAPAGLMRDASAAIVRAAAATGVRRVIVMSAFGVGESLPRASRIARVMYRVGAKAVYADKAAGEALLRAADLDWALAYPVLLTDGPASGRLTALDLATMGALGGLPRVARADVAEFLLGAAEDGAWSRRTAVITTR